MRDCGSACIARSPSFARFRVDLGSIVGISKNPANQKLLLRGTVSNGQARRARAEEKL